jgi:hypothetical protein
MTDSMSDEQKTQAHRDDWKLRWTFRGIAVLTLASFLASSWLVREQPTVLRVIAKTSVPLGVFFGSWTVAWLCGLKPLGG